MSDTHRTDIEAFVIMLSGSIEEFKKEKNKLTGEWIVKVDEVEAHFTKEGKFKQMINSRSRQSYA